MLIVKRDFEAFLDTINTITILLPITAFNGESTTFNLIDEDTNYPITITESCTIEGKRKYICRAPFPIELGKTYYIIDQHNRKTDLQVGAVIRTKEFDEMHYYDGKDLGVSYFEKESIFCLWAPTASAVKVKLTSPDQIETQHNLVREEKGIWRLTVNGNLEGYEYTYLVCVNLIWREAVDPYTKATNRNHTKGIIINLEKTKIQKVKSASTTQHPTDAVIYEVHVRDFSIHPSSGMKHKGKYLAFTEKNTVTAKGKKSGVNYLKDLGVTHIELLPVNAFGGIDEKTKYNWGYNPILFNTPEGSYSTNPANPYSRITELKKAIQSLHEEGLQVIIDVVYNHVFIREESSFEKIVPGYYFRHDENGMPSNGTGVGNDFASERRMSRKFIIDSVSFWLEEYDVDGFRFDLMGILDVSTMNSVRKTVDNLKEHCLLLGEGWELNTPIPSSEKTTINNSDKTPNICFFNDYFRDNVKGSTFHLSDKGFVLGNNKKLEEMKKCITGSTHIFQKPIQSINYVESHDNHTMWDKMEVCSSEEDIEIRKKRQLFALSIALLSQGVPFLHAGQEFFRTKKGDGNSYKSADEINRLDWDRKDAVQEAVDYVKGIISVRKHHQAFRFTEVEEIKKYVTFFRETPTTIVYGLMNVSDYGPWRNILIIHHNGQKEERIQLPHNGEEWEVIGYGDRISLTPIFSATNEINIPLISTAILIQQ